MKVLLIGGSGLLGHNVLQCLIERNYEVRVLVRSEGAIRLLSAGEYEVMVGSLLDKQTLCRAAQGCDAIINCAGTTDMSLLHYDDYLPINRDLCALLVEAMECNDINTIVSVSTANTIGYGKPNICASETSPMKAPFTHSYYACSKKEGEQLLQEVACRKPCWHVVIINPGFIVGAYDVKPSSGKLLLAGYRKRIMVAPRGGKSFVAVDTVATAIVNALHQGSSGHKYLLTGDNIGLREFYNLQAKVCGYRQYFFYLPNCVVLLAGLLGNFLRRLGIKTQLSTRNVRQLLVMEHYDNSKAINDLTPKIIPLSDAIRSFFAWRNSV